MKYLHCLCGQPICVDDEDHEKLKPYKWSCVGQSLIKAALPGRNYLILTRQILPYKEGFMADHVDRDIHNNVRTNLRYATKAENTRNAKTRKDNELGYKGVHYRPDNNKYRARIQVDKKRITVGEFSTLEAAALAYNEAALKYHGAFAVLNIIKPNETINTN